jgi:hypothetical protein
MMREHYKYHYFGSSSPSASKPRDYNDPAWTAEERERNAALFAKQKAALRRAKIAERCIVFGAAGLALMVMLPVILPIVLGIAAKALWSKLFRSAASPAAEVPLVIADAGASDALAFDDRLEDGPIDTHPLQTASCT